MKYQRSAYQIAMSTYAKVLVQAYSANGAEYGFRALGLALGAEVTERTIRFPVPGEKNVSFLFHLRADAVEGVAEEDGQEIARVSWPFDVV